MLEKVVPYLNHFINVFIVGITEFIITSMWDHDYYFCNMDASMLSERT